MTNNDSHIIDGWMAAAEDRWQDSQEAEDDAPACDLCDDKGWVSTNGQAVECWRAGCEAGERLFEKGNAVAIDELAEALDHERQDLAIEAAEDEARGAMYADCEDEEPVCAQCKNERVIGNNENGDPIFCLVCDEGQQQYHKFWFGETLEEHFAKANAAMALAEDEVFMQNFFDGFANHTVFLCKEAATAIDELHSGIVQPLTPAEQGIAEAKRQAMEDDGRSNWNKAQIYECWHSNEQPPYCNGCPHDVFCGGIDTESDWMRHVLPANMPGEPKGEWERAERKAGEDDEWERIVNENREVWREAQDDQAAINELHSGIQ